MAKVQYGSIVTELKGKVAGHVFQGGNVGYVLRTKGYTPGLSSTKRQTANGNLIANTTAWRSLTDIERATWIAGANNWAFLNKFGGTYYGSGFQVFNAFNTARLTLGLSVVNSMPAVDAPNFPGAITPDIETPDGFIMNWEHALDADCYVQVFSAPAISAGRNVNYQRWSLVKTQLRNGSTDIDLGSAYNALFGDLVLGTTIPYKIVFRKGAFPYAQFTSTGKFVVTAP